MSPQFPRQNFCLVVIAHRQIRLRDPDAALDGQEHLLARVTADAVDSTIATILPHAVPFAGALDADRRDWLARNAKGLWMHWSGLRFARVDDAALFRLFHG